MRGCWHLPDRSRRGQPQYEARTGNRCLAIGADRASAILCPDPSAMGFDDLLRNREPQAGILAEPLMRAIRVKPLEDSLEGVIPNAWPVIVDDDFDFGFQAAADEAHLVAGAGKRLGVHQEIGDHLSQPGIVAGNRKGIRRTSSFEANFDGDVVAEPGLVGYRGQGGAQAAAIDRSPVLTPQFAV